jgi:hypothetical protein
MIDGPSRRGALAKGGGSGAAVLIFVLYFLGIVSISGWPRHRHAINFRGYFEDGVSFTPTMPRLQESSARFNSRYDTQTIAQHH